MGTAGDTTATHRPPLRAGPTRRPVAAAGRLLGVRPGEGRLAILVAVLFALVDLGRGSGEVAADTLLLSRSGPAVLPVLFVVLGAASLVIALGYGAAAGQVPRTRLFAAVPAAGAAILFAERLALARPIDELYPLLWLTVNLVAMLLVTVTWSVAGSVLDARQAKRLFPLFTGAAILGGFVGTAGAGPVAALFGAENLVLVHASLLAAGAAIIARLGSAIPAVPVAAGRARPSLARELGAGFEYVRRSPLMRLVAAAYVLFGVLFFTVSFSFYRAVSEAYPSEAELAAFLGLVYASITAASFVVALFLANRVFARLGIATAALLLPIVYVGGFAVWIVGFGLLSAVGFRIAQQVTQRGISNAAWSAFYNVVPGGLRPQVLVFNDGVPGQIGTILSGLLLLVAGTVLGLRELFLLGGVVAVAVVAIVWAIRRRYGQALVATLRAGLTEQVLEGGPGLTSLANDPQVAEALRGALADPSPGLRRLAAEMLGRLRATGAGTALASFVEDPDAGVRATVVEALGRLGDPAAAPVVAACLVDPEPGVRATAIDALFALRPGDLLARAAELAADPAPAVRSRLAVCLVRAGEEDRPHGILAALLEADSPEERIAGLDAVGALGGHAPSPRLADYIADPSPAVRAAAVLAIGAISDRVAGVDEPIAVLAVALEDEDAAVRGAAARALRERDDDPTEAILGALRSGSERAQTAALRALDGRAGGARGPLVDWATGQIERAAALRADGAALSLSGADGRSAAEDYLAFLLRRRGHDAEERVLMVLSLLGAPEASGVIRRCLLASDPERRAQAMEALETLADRSIAAGLMPLLEGEDRPAPGRSALDVLGSLADDPDPWIRALATRSLLARLDARRESVLVRARRDPDPTVRATAAVAGPGGELDMPETRSTLDVLERILFLRRVPLFARLAPEDLQRVAATAFERYYADGEVIFREGDLGDELVVIADGSVRVVRADDDTDILRRYGVGDHIGELAVLREMPRAATVIAEAGGVRGLVIAGEGLKAMLRERPEAAMAMLATLADRISAQP